MAAVTLTTLRSRVRTRADMNTASPVTDSELDYFINTSLDELYGILVNQDKDLFVSSASYTIDSVVGNGMIALPSDFYSLLGVDMLLGGERVDLRKFQFKERNRYRNSTFNTVHSAPVYRLEGSNVRLYPQPPDGVTGTLWYNPTRTQLVNGSDSVNFPLAWEEYAVIDAAIKCLRKEESDTQELMADKQLLLSEIRGALSGRDSDEPERVTDLSHSGGRWPSYLEP